MHIITRVHRGAYYHMNAYIWVRIITHEYTKGAYYHTSTEGCILSHEYTGGHIMAQVHRGTYYHMIIPGCILLHEYTGVHIITRVHWYPRWNTVQQECIIFIEYYHTWTNVFSRNSILYFPGMRIFCQEWDENTSLVVGARVACWSLRSAPHHLSVSRKNTKEKYSPHPPFFLSWGGTALFFPLQKKHLCAGFSILEKIRFLSTSSYNFFPVFQEISLNPDVEPCPTAWSGHLGPIPVNFGKEHMLCKTGLVQTI